MNIIEKRVKDLKPYEKNPRLNDDAVKYVAESIKEFGFKVPIVIDKDNNIVCGHTRWKACKKLKIDTVPCVVADDLTEEQIRAYRLADNKVGEKAEWDLALLDTELAEIETIDMTLLGFDDKEEETPQEVVEDDFDEEPPAEPIAKYGDLYQLGRHRLMCGDSTKTNDVECLMGGHKADMVFTDPPYNVDYSNIDRPKPSKKDLGKIKNDVMSEEDFSFFLGEVFQRLDEATKDDSSFYIWYADKTTIPFYTAILETNAKFSQMLIWEKPLLLGRNKYQYSHEPCIFAVKGSPYFTNDRTKKTVWNFGGYDKSKNVHPTQKPIFLPAEAINNSSQEGDAVLDLFGGSGSTLIACEQLNRQCFMMELDPKYIDVIINRWETFTGKKAELINGERKVKGEP